MMEFLKSRGDPVLNLIEIRKVSPGEKLTTRIPVAENWFDY